MFGSFFKIVAAGIAAPCPRNGWRSLKDIAVYLLLPRTAATARRAANHRGGTAVRGCRGLVMTDECG
jgi:hypothetical protein